MQKCNSYIHSVSVLSQCDRFGSTTYTNPSLPRHPRVDGNHSESVQQPSKVSLSVMEMTDFISLFLMHSMKEVLSHLQVWYRVDASVLQFLRFGWHRFNSTSTSTLSPSIITPITEITIKMVYLRLSAIAIWCCIYQSMQHSTSVKNKMVAVQMSTMTLRLTWSVGMCTHELAMKMSWVKSRAAS